jgi:hypothetical protein
MSASRSFHGVDDLGVVDAAHVGGGDPEVGTMTELALDHDQRDSLRDISTA